jgi:hypothetical protein
VARVQNGFFVREVVIQCGLANAELLGDVIQGRGVVSLFPKCPKGCVQDFHPPPTPLLTNVGDRVAVDPVGGIEAVAPGFVVNLNDDSISP